MTLREAGVTLIDCDHRTPPAAGDGYPYVAIPQLKKGHIDFSDARRISAEHFAEWTTKARPEAHDVVLSRRCNPGETAYVRSGVEFALGQNLVLLRSNGSAVHPPFLRWLVRSPAWWEQIGKFLNVGAVFDSLRCADVPNFQFLLPPLNEQRAIAHILGTLDDKIELNRRMNKTLEDMARALFKSWFVDFDPVRAKAAGREVTAVHAAFPLTLEDSVVGEIPAGWNEGSLLRQARLLSGGTPKTSRLDYWNGEVKWASAKDVSQSSDLFLVETERTITAKGLEESATQVIPAFSSVVVARGATTGRMALLADPMAINQTCYALATTTGTPFSLHLRFRHEIDNLVHTAHGSVFDTITTRTFEASRVVLPPEELLREFEKRVEPAFLKIRANVLESELLTKVRNEMLPKLISGELRGRDCELTAARGI